jgi:hypothetical protein
MKLFPRIILLIPFMSLLVSGCSSLDRMGTRMDVATRRIDKPGRPVYEGQLLAQRKVGSMTAMEFVGGQYYDVAEASRSLFPGDIIRIYETDRGYEARLWRSVESASKTHESANRS